MNETSSGVGFNINAGVPRETIAEARAAIIDILNTLADQSTKVVALETLKVLCESKGSVVTGCVAQDIGNIKQTNEDEVNT